MTQAKTLARVDPMTSPQRYLTRMGVFMAVTIIVVIALNRPLSQAFLANSVLNGVIVGAMVLGILYIFRQVWMLNGEVAWIDAFRSHQPGAKRSTPRLLAPMATMLGERQGRVSLSTASMRTILDGLSARLDESRDISRYLIGLLIFLGLLGTFWGLLETVRAVAAVIADLEVTGSDTASIFNDLTTGLEAPLAGMGTAFSSSLFGLAGSLLLGFLDLQASQAQNRFYNDLEEWLSGVTRLSSGGVGFEGEPNVPAYIQALLETTADSLDNLQRTIAQGEESRGHANATLMSLAARLTTFSDQMKTEQELMARFAESQSDLRPALERLAAVQSGGMDEATRNHIRNVDVYLARLLEETTTGRNQMVQEIRSEIRLLARTMAALAEEGEPR
ncbi:MAG: flagellar motor protein MotA [Alphaproteobacteria bacterium]